MITCVAIDDEPLALRQIKSYIEKTPFLQLIQAFSDSIDAFAYLQENQVDLLFVDINMPDLSGMDFVKSLTNPPKVIFVTAYREYAVEGFQVDAADYLVKPISFSNFLKSVEKTRQRYFSVKEDVKVEDHPISEEVPDQVHAEDHYLFIKAEYKIVRINFNDIKYIEGMRDYVRFHLENEKPIMTLLSMKSLEQHLPKDMFMRVHRSYFVNLNKVHTIERNRIVFDQKVYIPISDAYKNEFQAFLDRKFLK